MINQTELDSIPPANLSAEEAILGAALISPEAAKTISEELSEDCFYSDRNSKIFASIKCLRGSGNAVDLIILTDYLTQRNILETVGGAAYLSRLIEDTPTTANLHSYILNLKDKSARRALIHQCQSAINDAYGDKDTADILAGVHQKATSLITECAEKDYLTGGDLSHLVSSDIQERIAQGVGFTGLSTGFDILDSMTGGFGEGQLITIGGVTGSGKSTILLDIAHSVAVVNRRCAAYFSVEMTAKEIGYRLLPKCSGIEAQKIKAATLDEQETARLLLAIETMKRASLIIDDTPNIKLSQLAAKVRRLKAKERIEIAFVDYIQIVRNPQKGQQTRFDEVASLALGLKGLARELNLPIVVGAQVNREYTKRQDKRPLVDDIRESAQVGHESDIVMFIHRDCCFDHAAGNGAELIVRKCRSGRTGTVKLWWDEKIVSFHEQ